MLQPIIDTHIHTWDLERASYTWLKDDSSILNRSWSLNELNAVRGQTNVSAGILVQAAGNFEDTELMLETARANSWIKGVVGWLPLVDATATKKILEEKYNKEKYFKGVRHQVHDEPDPAWLLQPAVIKSLQLLASHDIAYDMVGISVAHIETTIKVAEKVPGLRMVFDHLNQPPIAKQEKFGNWGKWMKAAAQHTNLHAKISGLGTAAVKGSDWTNADLQPYIEFALNTFGTDRCFCGGDWPVSLLAGSYAKTWQSYESILTALLSDEEKKKVLYTNAVKYYNLDL
ncbi:MAG: amidohydrolase family protein [Chitinophagaceae bacterium]